jgi:hypothetical protein
MRKSRILPILLGVISFLVIVFVGVGLAQTSSTDSEPNSPFHSSDTQGLQDSSEPATSDETAAFQDATLELTDAQRNSSAPISGYGVVPTTLPFPGPAENLSLGIDETTALSSLRIPGTALKPRNSDATYVPTGGGGCFYSTASSYTIFNTGVYLPQGSLVDTLRMYYCDSSLTDSSAWFTVYDLYGDIVEEWQVSSSGNTGYGFNDSSMINHIIDYSQYSYAINWRPYVLGTTMWNCGFRIFYQPPVFPRAYLPAILNNP